MKIHLIGIGGIGISALAKYYLTKGFFVSGSDLIESEITQMLGKQGAEIIIGPHKAENISQGINLIIYSAAIENKNPELAEAKKRKIKCQTYAEALGDLTKKYFTIAVSGTHGKSTTTAMLALITIKAGFDSTVIVGTKLREFGNSNFRAGKSKYLVIEADEYAGSFLNYWPKIIVLTNIEEDHLDYYKDLNQILAAFKKYVGHLGKGGILVANGDDENIIKISQRSKVPGLAKAEPRAGKIQKFNSKFKINGLNLKIPGGHNLMNAYAAITVARALKIPDRVSLKALNNFNGTWRRFEYKGMVNGAEIFDDYGHHPTEIKATLKGARELLTIRHKPYAAGHLWCIFQPHQYQRTYKLYKEFVAAFDDADKIILLPIYSVAGREKESIKKIVNSEKLLEDIKRRYEKLKYKEKTAVYFNSFEKCANYLKNSLKKGDIAVIMGAGDIYKLTEQLSRTLSINNLS